MSRLLSVLAVVFVTMMVFLQILNAAKKSAPRQVQRSGGFHGRPVSSDGHVIPPEEDITVDTGSHYSRFRKEAAKEFGDRYIVHNDPTQG